MKILIKDNAKSFYVSLSVHNHQNVNWEWADKLGAIEGKWLNVETEFLFSNQFSTAPIPGVSSNGLRIMAYSVQAIEGDVRSYSMRCEWCGHCALIRLDTCPNCDRGAHVKWFKSIDGIAYTLVSPD